MIIETGRYLWLAVLLSSGVSLHATGASVEERDGNIYLRNNKTVSMKQVTDSRHDHSPALSPDGSRIVFVRDLLGDRDYNDFTRVGPATRVMQLWVADVVGGGPPELVLDSPVEVQGDQFSGFYTPQFSSDGKLIYFLIQFSASSGAIVRLAVGGRQPVYVTDALDFAVIPVGKYKDDLVVYQHRHKLAQGYYDWFYLLKPNAEEVGVIGQDKHDVYDFVNTYLGDVSACRRWDDRSWMTCITAVR